jgi:serine/threonine-protein kinase
VDDAARALIGRTLGGRFKLTSFIGEGAMASVFRGEQSAEPHQVAVKVMHRGLTGDQSFLGRFQREARAAASIEHRNTVRILEHGRDRDVVYIAMELVAGQDLFEVLVRERRLSQARAARIVVQVGEALEAAHRHGVVHRDLKPENVMLIRDPVDPDAEVVKVLDFGIAKLLQGERSSGDVLRGRADSVITLVGTVIGTPEYMSPEQARGIPPIDARSDVYAAGVLLYQLVTGRLPFRGESPIDVILQHIERPPVPPRTLVPALHPGLERIILTALAKWPAERQQSARQLADELAALLPELEDPRPGAAPILEGADEDDDDEGTPTVRMLPDEAWLAATRRSEPALTQPVLPAAPPEAGRRAGAEEVPSPWALAPEAPPLAVQPEPDGHRLLGWWILLIAIAILCAVIWLTREIP